MKTVTVNRISIRVSASDERALRIIKGEHYISPKENFADDPNFFQSHFDLPTGDHATELGISELRKNDPALSLRARKFFKENPRRRVVVIGEPRRIDAILRALDKT